MGDQELTIAEEFKQKSDNFWDSYFNAIREERTYWWNLAMERGMVLAALISLIENGGDIDIIKKYLSNIDQKLIGIKINIKTGETNGN